MARVYKFIANSSSVTEAKFDRYIEVHNIIQNLGHSTKSMIEDRIKHSPEQTIEADRDTQRVMRPVAKMAIPLGVVAAGAVLSKTRYSNYLKQEALANETINKVNFEKLTEEMKKTGINPEHNVFNRKAMDLGFRGVQIEKGLNITSFDLDGSINHGTIVQDISSKNYIALSDYSNLSVSENPVKYNGEVTYDIKGPDEKVIATVSKKTLDKSFGDRVTFETAKTGVIKGRDDYIDVKKAASSYKEDLISANPFKRSILHNDITYDPISGVVAIKNDPGTKITPAIKKAFDKYTEKITDPSVINSYMKGTLTKDIIEANGAKIPAPLNSASTKDILDSAINDKLKPNVSLYKVGANSKAKVLSFKAEKDNAVTNVLKYKRGNLRYKIDDNGNLHTFNLNKESIGNSDMYKNFCRLAKRQKDDIDPSILNDARELRRVSKKLEKADKKYAAAKSMTNPKRLIRNFGRLIVKESIKGSEGNETLQMLDQLSTPALKVTKDVANIVPNTIYNIAGKVERRRLAKQWMKENKEILSGTSKKLLKRKAMEFARENSKLKHIKIKDLRKLNPIARAFGENIRYKITMRYASKLANSSNDFVKYVGNRAIIKEVFRNSKMSKDAANAYIHANRQILMSKSNLYRKHVEKKMAKETIKEFRRTQKAASKASKRAADRVYSMSRKAAKKSSAIALKEMDQAIREAKVAKNIMLRKEWTKRISSRLALLMKTEKEAVGATTFLEKVTEAVKTVGKGITGIVTAIVSNPYSALFAAVLIVFVILFSQFAIMAPMLSGQADDLNKEISRFESTNPEKWEEYHEEIMKCLKKKHEKMLKKIEDTTKQYDTADVEFPSGEQENYKELFVAMEIMLQYNPDCVSYDEYEDIALELYDRTHQMVTVEYTYYDDEGQPHNACHVYVYIMRGDQLCYEVMSDVYSTMQSEDAKRGTGYIYCPSTNVKDDNWLQIVRAMKQSIADSNCYYYDLNDKRTDNDTYIDINVNGKRISVRPDCSGLVSACLYIYGSATSPSGYNSSALASLQRGTSAVPGFTVMDWSGWDNLCEGDIIARNGHTEIFAYNAGGQHWVYNCGSDHSVSVASPTVSGHSSYATVIRPGNAGTSITGKDFEDTPETTNPDPSGGMGIVDESVETGKYDNSYTGIVYDANFKEEYVNLSISNTANVEFDEETGNENGYEDLLIDDINTELSGSSKFTASNYEEGNKDHALSNKASASDFVRYILGKHGVKFSMDDMYAIWNDESVTTNDLAVGDIVWYMPKTDWSKKVSAITPWSKLTPSAIPSVDGKELDESEKLFYDTVVPCIYIGNNEIVAYSRDLAANNASSSGAAVRKYNLSSLDSDNIIVINKKSGYTVDAIFGYTDFFEGWNNENITYFMEMYYDTCWEDGEKKFKFKNEDEHWVLGLFSKDTYTVDYSWYKEDYFEGNQIYATEEHYNQYYDDMLDVFIRTYDKYGILPSFGYTYSNALTNGRTTEESLSYFNIFEMINSTRSEEGFVEKYNYDDNGDSSVTSVSYRVFNSYDECVKSYYEWLLDNGNEDCVIDGVKSSLSESENGAHESFDAQLNKFKSHNLVDDELDKIMEEYNAKSSDLIEADRKAIDRKKTLMVINHYARVINEEANEINSWATLDNYTKINAYKNILNTAVNHFTSNYGAYCTNDNLATLNNARDAINRAETVANSLKTFRDENESYFITDSRLECPGHYERYCSFAEIPSCNNYDEEYGCMGHGAIDHYCSGCTMVYEYEDWNIGGNCFGHGGSTCSGDTKCSNLICKDGTTICGGHGNITYCDE